MPLIGALRSGTSRRPGLSLEASVSTHVSGPVPARPAPPRRLPRLNPTLVVYVDTTQPKTPHIGKRHVWEDVVYCGEDERHRLAVYKR